MTTEAGCHSASASCSRSERSAGLSLVVLTYPCEAASLLLEHLAVAGLDVRAVVLERRGALNKLHRVRRVVGWRGTACLGFRKVAALLGMSRRERWRSDDFYRQHAGELVVVDDLNSSESYDALRRLGPDVAIIGGAGPLQQHVFGVPRFGTLNMHPGLLPEYRGLSSVWWAVLEGGEVGATLHVVDEGIDTGPIVARRSVPVLPGDTFERLRGRIIEANLAMLVDALGSLTHAGHRVATPQPCGTGRLYHAIPSAKRRAAEDRLAAIAARAVPGKG